MKLKYANYKSIMRILMFFFLFRFCSPYIIYKTGIANIYTTISKVISIFILVIYFVKYGKISIPFAFIGSFYVIRFLITIYLSPSNISRVLMGAYPILVIVALIDIMINCHKYSIIRDFDYSLKILCIPSAILSLVAPDLFGQHTYFIGGENQVIFPYAVSIVVAFIAAKKKPSKGLYLYILLLTTSIIHIFSAGNLIGWLVLLVIYIFARSPNFNSIMLFWGYVCLWVAVVFLQVQNLLSWLIVDILHKDLTLTNRTVIWENAFSAIKQSPWFGYGVQDTVNLFYTYIERPGRPTVDAWFSAHNQVVQTLYESGIVSMLPIVLFTILVIKKMQNNKDSDNYLIMLSCIMGVLISLMVEAPAWDSYFILLTLAYYIGNYKTKQDNFNYKVAVTLLEFTCEDIGVFVNGDIK